MASEQQVIQHTHVKDIEGQQIIVGDLVAYGTSGYGHGYNILTGEVIEIIKPDSTVEYIEPSKFAGKSYVQHGEIKIKPRQHGRKTVLKRGGDVIRFKMTPEV